MCIGAIHMPNTNITRPHPLFWRAILAIFVAYAVFITYLLLLPINDARQAMRVFDDTLGKPLPERSYGEDCRFFTPDHPTSYFANFSDAVFDVHFIAHFLGWWGKMLFMRDWYLAWACSIGFELCEITFRHWLPNFWECWWDHLFLDLFGCNLIGMYLGWWTLEYFGTHKPTWVQDYNEKEKKQTTPEPCSNMLVTAIEKLRPTVFERYSWDGLSSY